MDDDRRRRFQGIERPRTARPEDPPAAPGSATGDRFGALSGPAGAEPAVAPPAPAAPSPHAERFRAPVQPALEVDAGGEERQPFIRCLHCETDNSRFVARCSRCGAALDGEAQLAFNQRLWAARRAEAAALAEAVEARQVAQSDALEEAAQARRLQVEAMAREVGQRERARLEREGLGDGGGLPVPGWGRGDDPSGWTGTGGGAPAPWPQAGGADHPDDDPSLPAGLRLLRRLPDLRWQVGAGVALLAAPALLYVAWPPAGVVAGVVVLVLFTPARWRSRARW